MGRICRKKKALSLEWKSEGWWMIRVVSRWNRWKKRVSPLAWPHCWHYVEFFRSEAWHGGDNYGVWASDEFQSHVPYDASSWQQLGGERKRPGQCPLNLALLRSEKSYKWCISKTLYEYSAQEKFSCFSILVYNYNFSRHHSIFYCWNTCLSGCVVRALMLFVGPISSRQETMAFSRARTRARTGPELVKAIRLWKNGFPKCSA